MPSTTLIELGKLRLDDLRAARRCYSAHRHYTAVDGGALTVPMLRSLFSGSGAIVVDFYKEMILRDKTHQDDARSSIWEARAAEPKVDVAELMVALALLVQGAAEDRVRFLFEVFGDAGFIERDSLHELFSSLSRSLARLQLAFPLSQPFIDQATRSCLLHASSDEDEDFSVASAPPLSVDDFVRWSSSDPLALKLQRMAETAKRDSSIIEEWKRRALAIRQRLDARDPAWCISAIGPQGSRRARAAWSKRPSMFRVAPFFAVTSAGPCVAFEVATELVVLMHPKISSLLCPPGRLSTMELPNDDGDITVTLAASDSWRPTYLWSAVLKNRKQRFAFYAGECSATDADVLVDLGDGTGKGAMRLSSDGPPRGDGYDALPLHILTREVLGFSSFDKPLITLGDVSLLLGDSRQKISTTTKILLVLSPNSISYLDEQEGGEHAPKTVVVKKEEEVDDCGVAKRRAGGFEIVRCADVEFEDAPLSLKEGNKPVAMDDVIAPSGAVLGRVRNTVTKLRLAIMEQGLLPTTPKKEEVKVEKQALKRPLLFTRLFEWLSADITREAAVISAGCQATEEHEVTLKGAVVRHLAVAATGTRCKEEGSLRTRNGQVNWRRTATNYSKGPTLVSMKDGISVEPGLLPNANVVVGPIVGLVLSTFAVIVVEVDQATEVTLRCEPLLGDLRKKAPFFFDDEQDLAKKEVSVLLEAGVPTPLKLQSLSPDTMYTYSLTLPQKEPLQGSFRTFNEWPLSISMIAVRGDSVGAWVDSAEPLRRKKQDRERQRAEFTALRAMQACCTELLEKGGDVRQLKAHLARITALLEKEPPGVFAAPTDRFAAFDRTSAVAGGGPVKLRESGAAAHLARDAASSRPDADLVVIVGAPVSAADISNVARILKNKTVDPASSGGKKQKAEAQKRATGVVRASIRAALASPASKLALAHGSHLIHDSLPQVFENLAAHSSEEGSQEAALLCSRVVSQYDNALRGVEEHDDASRDSGGNNTLCRFGSTGVVLLSVASLDCRAARAKLNVETRRWLRAALSLDHDDDLTGRRGTPQMNSLIVVSDVALSGSGNAAERAVMAMLKTWVGRAPRGLGRAFHVVSPLGDVVVDSTEVQIPHLGGGYALLRSAARPNSPTLLATVEKGRARVSVAIICDLRSTSARLLFELNAEATVAVIYRHAGDHQQAPKKMLLVAAEAHRPVVMLLDDLEPDTFYEYAVIATETSDGEEILRQQGNAAYKTLRTLSVAPAVMRVVALRSMSDPEWLRKNHPGNFAAEMICSSRRRPHFLQQDEEFNKIYPRLEEETPKRSFDLVIHLSGPLRQEAGVKESSSEETMLPNESARGEVSEQLRDEYRHCLSLPHVADLSSAQIFCAAPPVVAHLAQRSSNQSREAALHLDRTALVMGEYAYTSDELKEDHQMSSSSLRRFGAIAVLTLDASRPLRASQWALLAESLQIKEIASLLICSDRSLLDDPESARLMTMLGDWLCDPGQTSLGLFGNPRRSALIICGGEFGCRTAVRDTQQSVVFHQLTVGDFKRSKRKHKIGRFELSDDGDSAEGPCYGVATMFAGGVTSTEISSDLVGNSQKLLVGPVLGIPEVTAFKRLPGLCCNQRVLFEISTSATVICAMEDVLSGEIFLATVEANKATLVSVEDLRLGRRYAVRIITGGRDLVTRAPADNKGRLLPHDVTASCYFQTPDPRGSEMNIAVTSGHFAELEAGDSDALSELSERLRSPFHGIDLHIVIGVREAALRNAALEGAVYLATGGTEELVRERFRQEYRLLFTSPSMRLALSSCPTIFATGSTLSLLSFLNKEALTGPSETKWAEHVSTVLSLARQVAKEYDFSQHDASLSTMMDNSVAVLVLDVEGVNLKTARNMELLEKVLNLEEVTVLVLVFECCAWRPRPDVPAETDLSREDVSWLLGRLARWRRAQGKIRDCKLICGAGGGELAFGAGLRSSLVVDGEAIEQVVYGPSAARPLRVSPFAEEPDVKSKEKQQQGVEEEKSSHNIPRSGSYNSPADVKTTVEFAHGDLTLERNYGVLHIATEVVLLQKKKKKRRDPNDRKKSIDKEASGGLLFRIGSCSATDAVTVSRRPLTNESAPLTEFAQRSATFRAPADHIDTSVDDSKTFAGFVSDANWMRCMLSEECEAARVFVGGGGFGSGELGHLVARTYSSSGLEELRRPKKLRVHLSETEGPGLTGRIRSSLAELHAALPAKHSTVFASLEDEFVATLIIARVTEEREAPLTLKDWHGFLQRCFGLAAVYRHVWANHDDHDQKRTNHLAQVAEEYDEEDEEEAVAADSVLETHTRRAKRRREEQKSSMLPPPADALFWIRPDNMMTDEMKEDQAKMLAKQQKELAKAKRKALESKRLEKYKKKLEKKS